VILCEKRLAMVVEQGAAMVYGSLSNAAESCCQQQHGGYFRAVQGIIVHSRNLLTLTGMDWQ
jgi:hypothetical protein